MTLLRQECPVCGRANSENRIVFKRDFRGIRALVPFQSYNVYVCETCGMAYAGDLSESVPLDEYYQKLSKYETVSTLCEENTGYYERTVLFLEKHITDKRSRIIDIGCGSGGLLAALQRSGFSNLYGMELSEKNCRTIEENLHIPAYRGSVATGCPELSAASMDIVILNAVLEHLLPLRDCVQYCISLLAEGGYILILCPDTALFPRIHDLYQQFSIEHINYFNSCSIARLFADTGMNMLDYEEYGLLSDGKLSDASFWWFGKTGENITPHFPLKQNGISEYLLACREQANHLRERSFHSKNGFYLWCAGTMSAMLVQLGILSEDCIRGVFDSNVNLQGKSVFGHIVRPPEDLMNLEVLPIYVASQLAYRSILAQIRTMGLQNEVIGMET